MNTNKAVAIIGIGCRFPGANSPEEFWRVLVNGENHIKEVPKDRWNVDYFHSSDKTAPGKTYTKHAGFIDEALWWDNAVFGINTTEAERMDPQQKLALEVSFKALEDAGIPMHKLKGTNTAVFMGSMYADYGNLCGVDPEFIDNYFATGTSNCVLANRLSYFYDIHGPSVSLDTACSTGLVGVHLGSQSILAGESDMAICGGVNIILSPNVFVGLSKARMSSEKGQCHTFSEDADGYVRGEGCGIVILKDLEKAIRDGNKIYGISTTALNSDGKASSPMTAPNSESQASLIRTALARAEVAPEDIQFVEMHGTGTPVGDPVETGAVASVIGTAKNKHGLDLCPVGSVKTNVGHLEAAAGMVGLIKVILMMQNKTMVKSILFGKLKSSLNMGKNGLHVLQANKPWKECDINGKCVRLASVNSFGFGGTNVHLVLQQDAKDIALAPSHSKETYTQVVLFSGVDSKATKASIKDALNVLGNNQNIKLKQLSRTSCFNRTVLKHRMAFCVDSLTELKSKLESTLNNESDFGKRVGTKVKVKTVFVFCGMGTHWSGMGALLYEKETIYRETIDKLHALFASFGDFDLRSCLSKDGVYDLSDPKYGQPSLFACQVALFDLWCSKGLSPDVVLGHSVGEVAASYASGHLSLEQAAYVIYHRGQCVSKAKNGTMLALGKIPIKQVRDVLKPFDGKVDIAACNSPVSCTISGGVEDIGKLQGIFEALPNKPFVRRLDVKVAYHSHFMDPILEDLKIALSKQSFTDQSKRSITCSHISTVYGKEVNQSLSDVSVFSTPDYWLKNVRQTVLFADALGNAINSENTNLIVEIGPKPSLKTNIRDIVGDASFEYVPSMSTNKDEAFYLGLCRSHEYSCVKQTDTITDCSSIPRVVFNKQYLYKEPEESTAFRNGAKDNISTHPFVRKSPTDPSDDIRSCICLIDNVSTPFVYEHLLDGTIIVPGATYVEAALAGFLTWARNGVVFPENICLSAHINFNNACYLKGETDKRKLDMKFHTVPTLFSKQCYFDVTSFESRLASGTVTIDKCEQTSPSYFNIKHATLRHTNTIDAKHLYNNLEAARFKYGPSLRTVSKITTDFRDSVVELDVPHDTNLSQTVLHPCVLDGLLQSGIVFTRLNGEQSSGQIMPYGIDRIQVFGKLTHKMFAYMECVSESNAEWKINAILVNKHGSVLAVLTGITYGLAGVQPNFDIREMCFMTSWEKLPKSNTTESDLVLEANGKATKSQAAVLYGKPTAVQKSPNLDTKNKSSILVIQDDQCEFPTSKLTCHTTRITVKAKDFQNTMRDENLLANMLPVDLTQFSAIWYMVGLHNKCKALNKFSGDKMNDLVLSTNMILLQLVKILNKELQPTPIFVVTKGVRVLQNCDKLAKENHLGAILGFTAHAVCRTVCKELSGFPIYPLDFETADKTELLCAQMTAIQESGYTEYAVEKGQMKYGTMTSTLQTCLGDKRQLNPSSVDPVKVTVHNASKALFLEPCKLTDKSKLPELNNIHIERSYLDPRCMLESMDRSESSQLITFDSIGSTDQGDKYLICQCHVLGNRADVKQANTLPHSDFPSAFPCLSFWLSVWHLLQGADVSSCVSQSIAFLAFDVSPLWIIVASTFSELIGYSIVDSVDKADVVVVFTDCFVSDQISVVNRDTKILVISEQQPKDRSFSIDSKLDLLEQPIINHTRKKISKCIQGFRTWLKAIEKRVLSKVLKKVDNEIERCCTIFATENTNFLDSLDNTAPVFISFITKSHYKNYVATNVDQLIKANAGYIVVGGRKGLAWETIKYLAIHGAKHICSVSRSSPQAEMMEEGDALQKHYGCLIYDYQAHTEVFTEMQKVFDDFQNDSRVPIKGIFYGAAVVRDNIIAKMTPENFEQVLFPKVAGVWNIYQLTKSLSLDIFLLYSSVASMFGNPGQTNYSAGNGFKDAIACLRHVEHGVGQSLCLGALDLGIVANNPSAKKKLVNLGLDPMKVPEIRASLDHALIDSSRLPVVGYVKFIWKSINRSAFYWSKPVQNQYTKLLQRYCHYFKRHESQRGQFNPSVKTSSYIAAALKEIAVLSDEDIDNNATISQLGVDSQDIQQLYSVIMEDVGFREEDLDMMEIGNTKLSEFIDKIDNLRVQYGQKETAGADKTEEDSLVMNTVTSESGVGSDSSYADKPKVDENPRIVQSKDRSNGHTLLEANIVDSKPKPRGTVTTSNMCILL